MSSNSHPSVGSVSFLFYAFFRGFVRALVSVVRTYRGFRPTISTIRALLFVGFVVVNFWIYRVLVLARFLWGFARGH